MKKTPKGNLLENNIMPEVGMEVWALIGSKRTFRDIPKKGVIKRVSNIDNRGLGNTYCDIDINGENRHQPIICIFDHKPKYVEIEDCFGKVKIWQ